MPYLIVGTHDNPIDKAIKLHLDCSRRVGSKSANPYRDIDNGFHITFYEKVELSFVDKSWKTGRLYEKADDPESKEQKFRQSAFTVSPLPLIIKQVTTTRQMFATSKNLRSADRYWTILLLTPSDFFEKPRKDLRWFDLGWKRFSTGPLLGCLAYAAGAYYRWLFPLKQIPPCELPPPSVSGDVVPGCHGWRIFKPLPLRQEWLELPVTKFSSSRTGI